MANSKVPVATKIPLSPMDGEEFYAVIIREERNEMSWDTMWLFRKGCGVAHLCIEKSADDSTMTVDGIKALDATGYFNENKEMLAEVVEFE